MKIQNWYINNNEYFDKMILCSLEPEKRKIMANPENFSWKASNGETLYGQKWLSTDNPTAIIILIHGLGEHIGRYAHVAEYFVQKNISIYGFDHRGHGKSSGKRGHISSTEDYFSDIEYTMETAKKEYPNAPLFLYGHSLGGNMVLNYSLRKKPPIAGVICTSPGLAVGEPLPPAKLFLAKILKTLLPSMTMDNGLDVNNLSHDLQVIKKYQEDPLVHPMISAKLAMDMFSNGDWVIENASNFSIPLLLMAGSEDHIINVEKVKEFAKKVPEKFITFELFPGLYHEIHNEFEQEKVFVKMHEWILQQLEIIPER